MDPLSLGQYLRESREAKELTIDNAVDALRIRKRLLESFEQGEFEFSDLSKVQTRGFLRNYAQYLGLDEDTVVIYYESALESRNQGGRWRRKRKKHKKPNDRQDRKRSRRRRRLDETNPPPEDEDSEPRPLAARSITDTNPSLPRVSLGDIHDQREQRFARVFNLLAVILVAGAALAVIVFVIYTLFEQAGDDTPENSFVLGELPATATRTIAPTFTPRPSEEGQPAIIQDYDGTGVVITIEITQRTWLRITTDGNIRIDQLVTPDTAPLEFRSINEIVLVASNAAALNIIYNGQQQGAFGGRGQAVDIIFGQERLNIQTGPGFEPTSPATHTPTPTQDSRPATLLAAQTPSRTPGPSPTPSDTPTITLTPSITFTPSDTPTATNTPTITFTPSNTPTASNTPPPTNTPTVTPTPSITPTPSPTAILPPRQTPAEPTSTKDSP